VSGRSYTLLLRQLVAHRAFVLRRAVREAGASLLLRAGALPGFAQAARWLDPNSAAALSALARRAARRGDSERASDLARVAEQLARNTTEISILGAFRNTLAWRRSGAALGGPGAEIASALEEGKLEAALTELERSSLASGSRIDAWLAIAAKAREAGRSDLCDELLKRAVACDPGRADVLRARAEAALARKDRAEARSCLERAIALDPFHDASYRELGALLVEDAPDAAREVLERALARDPESDATLLALEQIERREPTGAADTLEVAFVEAPDQILLGDRRHAALELRCEGPCSLYLLEPFGGGLASAPRGRIELAAGVHEIEVEIRALRPDSILGSRPWRLGVALCNGHRVARASIEIAVRDPRPGHAFYVITEDHEIYDERETAELDVVRRTIVDKSKLAERIANGAGAPWTHMVDVGSLALLGWAAERSPSWRALHEDAREHLVDAVTQGNDLGLHVHGFHLPEAPGFVHGFDPEGDRVTTEAGFLEATIPERGFWSRAFPELGAPEIVGSRCWATWRGVAALESLGRLGDPCYRVALFRAGSLDYGDDAAERGRSTELLRRLEVLADSDVPKPRLYHRIISPTPYAISRDIRDPVAPVDGRLLEIRAEFNIESDFLSDVGVLNRYVDLRMKDLEQAGGRMRPGVHIICAMTHDKFINWRMGKEWDSLDPDYGDWRTIGRHLRHVGKRHQQLRFVRPRDAVLAWYDYFSPELMAWRDEECIELSLEGAATERFRYSIRLLGEGIAVSSTQPRWVRLNLPAWCHGRVRRAGIEREGLPWPARELPVEPRALEFQVDSREADFELVLELDAGFGIAVEPSHEGPDFLQLESRLPYRNATIEIPAELSADGEPRRVRGVRLRPERGGSPGARRYRALLDPETRQRGRFARTGHDGA